jgi:hypothetical protein
MADQGSEWYLRSMNISKECYFSVSLHWFHKHIGLRGLARNIYSMLEVQDGARTGPCSIGERQLRPAKKFY